MEILSKGKMNEPTPIDDFQKLYQSPKKVHRSNFDNILNSGSANQPEPSPNSFNLEKLSSLKGSDYDHDNSSPRPSFPSTLTKNIEKDALINPEMVEPISNMQPKNNIPLNPNETKISFKRNFDPSLEFASYTPDREKNELFELKAFSPQISLKIPTDKQVPDTKLPPRTELKQSHSSKLFLETKKRRVKLCCCCLSFGHSNSAFMCICINDIIISANLSILGYIVTFNFRFSIFTIVFFLISSTHYVWWRVEKKELTKCNYIYLAFRWIFSLLITVPYGIMAWELFPVLYNHKKLQESGLTQIQKQWLEVLSLNRLILLAVLLFVLLIYFLVNISWNCKMWSIIREKIKIKRSTKRYREAQRKNLDELEKRKKERKATRDFEKEMNKFRNMRSKTEKFLQHGHKKFTEENDFVIEEDFISQENDLKSLESPDQLPYKISNKISKFGLNNSFGLHNFGGPLKGIIEEERSESYITLKDDRGSKRVSINIKSDEEIRGNN